MLQPHHDGSPLYVSTLTPDLGDVVKVRMRIPVSHDEPLEVLVRSNPDREPFFNKAVHIGTAGAHDWWEAEIRVANPLHRYRWLVHYASGHTEWINQEGVHRIETRDDADFALVAHPAPPAWATDAVLYQVFPDRFARSEQAAQHPTPGWALAAEWDEPVIGSGPGVSEQLYGGDLPGVEAHLDHLVELGATVLYLTPVFPGASNHRYDASTFDVVDPLLGGDGALISLVEAAHARGLKVMGDLTSNHTGDTHAWFQAALADEQAPEREFYYFHEGGTYAAWLGHGSLPKLNWNSQELRQRFIEGPDSVVGTWLRPPYSFDGWRIDVANMTGRYEGDDLNAEVRQIIRRTMIEINPDTLLLGESTNDATDDFQGDAWHGAMTYANFTRPVWGWLSVPGSAAFGGLGMARSVIPSYSGLDLHAQHQRFVAGIPWRTRLHNMNALDTHDTPRFVTNALPGAVPVALGMAVSLPGIPVVWAGDELGLSGVNGEDSRTPMPWESLDEHADSIALHRELLALRSSQPALRGGGMRWLHVGEEALVWVRETEGSSVLCVAARGFYDVVIDEGDLLLDGEPERLFGEGGASVFGASGLRLTGAGPAFAAWGLPGVEVPRAEGEQEQEQREMLDENASQDAALAHGEPAAPTLTAAWSKDTAAPE
ncbi:glycoside hydrolase family 13 protein [Agrococcus sp. Marseille-P2731]|uniref:glycoside hydrolase family 13 protein n=1 Tax=Agrococcus sp. Marseille-P2731 TaxID=1841862 RepID=UPI000931A616|nr:glycoside hydrolase family 13 protein [Agrococcus sp. Marseille-P2731]